MLQEQSEYKNETSFVQDIKNILFIWRCRILRMNKIIGAIILGIIIVISVQVIVYLNINAVIDIFYWLVYTDDGLYVLAGMLLYLLFVLYEIDTDY